MKNILSFKQFFSLCFFYFIVCTSFLSANDYTIKNQDPIDFNNILLVINCDEQDYKCIDFLKEIYSPFFSHIIFYGEEPHPEINVISHEKGLFSHKALVDAMTYYPHFDGYLLIQSHCFLQVWNFGNFDKNKIWFSYPHYTCSLNIEEKKWPFWFWESSYGKEAIQKAIQNLPHYNKRQLENNLKGRDIIAFGWSDCVYIPARLKEKFLAIALYFENPSVHSDIALANILLSLEKKENWEILNSFFKPHPFSTNCPKAIYPCLMQSYDLNCHWVFPMNFSSVQHMDYATKLIAQAKSQSINMLHEKNEFLVKPSSTQDDINIASNASDTKKADDTKLADKTSDTKKADDTKLADKTSDTKKADDTKLANKTSDTKKADDTKLADKTSDTKKADDTKLANKTSDTKKGDDTKLAGKTSDTKKADDTKLANKTSDTKKADDTKLADKASDTKKADDTKLADKASDTKKGDDTKLANKASDTKKGDDTKLANKASDTKKGDDTKLADNTSDTDNDTINEIIISDNTTNDIVDVVDNASSEKVEVVQDTSENTSNIENCFEESKEDTNITSSENTETAQDFFENISDTDNHFLDDITTSSHSYESFAFAFGKKLLTNHS